MKRLALLLLLATPLLAQEKALTLDALFDPKTMTRFGGAVQRGFDWIDDTTFVWPRRDAEGTLVEWRVFDVATGKERPLFDAAKVQRAFEEAGLTAEAAKEIARSSSLTFDAKKSAAVIQAADDLFLYSFVRNTATRLTSAPGEEEEADVQSRRQEIAFVRANDLYVVDLAGRERRITTDGSDVILNGKLDYVYQEEVYGRGNFKGYWWSPDSRRIAFLRLDETRGAGVHDRRRHRLPRQGERRFTTRRPAIRTRASSSRSRRRSAGRSSTSTTSAIRAASSSSST